MRVDWVIAARWVQRDGGGLVEIKGGGIDHIAVPDFPARVDINIAARVVGVPDPGKSYDLTVSVLDEQNDEVSPPLTGGISFEQTEPGDPPDFPVSDTLAVTARGIPIERPGIYVISAWIDGSGYRLPIRVLKQ